jgi:hypothetical protein
MNEQHNEHRMPYDDAETPTAMHHDCEAVARELHLEECPHHDAPADVSAHDFHTPPVSDELASTGEKIHLHFH